MESLIPRNGYRLLFVQVGTVRGNINSSCFNALALLYDNIIISIERHIASNNT